MADLKRLQTAVEVGDRETAVEVTQQAIDEEIPPKTVLDAMTDAMGVVGQRFQDNEIYVPEMLISARAMKAAVALLEPLLIGSGYKPDSVAVMGTIKGDLHDIGKNLVAMMLEGAGFKVINLGRDVAPEKFVAAVEEHHANIVGISALMTTTMPAMKRTIDALLKAGLREQVKVMVGGAPVSQAFADEIGADGYAKDSTLAVLKAKSLLGVAVS
jgi:5-methyltetrahydrofolate--homocysteine methyltransferase